MIPKTEEHIPVVIYTAFQQRRKDEDRERTNGLYGFTGVKRHRATRERNAYGVPDPSGLSSRIPQCPALLKRCIDNDRGIVQTQETSWVFARYARFVPRRFAAPYGSVSACYPLNP